MSVRNGPVVTLGFTPCERILEEGEYSIRIRPFEEGPPRPPKGVPVRAGAVFVDAAGEEGRQLVGLTRGHVKLDSALQGNRILNLQEDRPTRPGTAISGEIEGLIGISSARHKPRARTQVEILRDDMEDSSTSSATSR